jgi:hypothetical protein
MSGFALGEIDTECRALDMVPDEYHDPKVSGARRTLALKYLHALDFKNPSDARKFIGLAENLLTSALVRTRQRFSVCAPAITRNIARAAAESWAKASPVESRPAQNI